MQQVSQPTIEELTQRVQKLEQKVQELTGKAPQDISAYKPPEKLNLRKFLGKVKEGPTDISANKHKYVY